MSNLDYHNELTLPLVLCVLPMLAATFILPQWRDPAARDRVQAILQDRYQDLREQGYDHFFLTLNTQATQLIADCRRDRCAYTLVLPYDVDRIDYLEASRPENEQCLALNLNHLADSDAQLYRILLDRCQFAVILDPGNSTEIAAAIGHARQIGRAVAVVDAPPIPVDFEP